jgi:hypothetical protein
VKVFEELFRCNLRFSFPKVPRSKPALTNWVGSLHKREALTEEGQEGISSATPKGDHSTFQICTHYAKFNFSGKLQRRNEVYFLFNMIKSL